MSAAAVSRPLGEDQQRAIYHVLRTHDRITGLRGLAGTGKTTALRELVAACAEVKIEPLFCAPTAAATDVLRKEGFEAKTLQSLLLTKPKLDERRLVVLDEAGAVGIDDMKRLFDLAHDARVVLSGDTGQHDSVVCETPRQVVDYWRLHIATAPHFTPECECMAVLLLNTRKRVKGHQLLSIGTMDTILVHPREVFRCAIIAAAACIVVIHNHPSGESTPSEADIKVTRDLIRAGQLLKIELIDHVVIGNRNHSSLRELGYFYA